MQIVAFFIAIGAVLYSTLTSGVASREVFGSSSAYGSKDTSIDDDALPYRWAASHLPFDTARGLAGRPSHHQGLVNDAKAPSNSC